MADGHAAFPCDPGQKNTTVEVFAQKLGRSALLPEREAACDDFRQANQAAISLDQVRAEHQAELVQRKRAGPFCGPDMRQDAFGQLCDDEIVFAYSELVYPDRLDLVIARNLVEAFARHMVMDVVKSAVDRAYRMRFQVYYACAVGGNEGDFNPPVVDIEFIAS